MQDKILYSSCFGFALGILIRSLKFLDLATVFFFLLLSISIFVIGFLINHSKWSIVLSIFIFAFSLGVFRFTLSDDPPPIIYESTLDDKATLSGRIIDEPDVRENNQKLTIEVGNGEDRVKVLATLGLEGNFDYGDRVNILGQLEKPENFTTDQGKNFDYVNYLRKDGIFYIMSYPQIDVVSKGHGSKIKSALFNIKEKFIEKIGFVVPPPQSLLMGGLILGERSAFSETLRQNFIDTGTIHIVALSGYNVTIVAEWIMKLFMFLPQNIGIGVGIFTIFLFVLMTGAGATSVRAGIMATLALVARATGRNYDVARALILAGVIMILINPWVLVYDVSFQLSFIATIAVIFLAPRMERYFLWVPKRFGLRDIVSVTCAAYIFVLPFILYKMGNLSLVALPANILILPFIPLTMLLGFLTGLLGFIFSIFSIPTGYLSYLLLNYELGVVKFFAEMPFASFSIPEFPLWLVLLSYTAFGYYLFRESIKKFFTEPL